MSAGDKMKTLLIVGAGPGLGHSTALKFGRNGFRIGLVARSQDKLDAAVAELARDSIEAHGVAADVMDRPSLAAALERLEDRLGGANVISYQPTPARADLAAVDELTVENVRHQLDYMLMGAMETVRAVLPGMLSRGDGAFLFTMGLAAREPIPSHANAGLAQAALRNYGKVLNRALAGRGVYAGVVLVAGIIRRSATEAYVNAGGGQPAIRAHFIDPDEIADLFWSMVTRRDRVEGVVGDAAEVAKTIT